MSAFYEKAKHATGARELQQLVGEFQISSHKADEQYYANGGKYLPLAVWSSKGFTEQHILQNSQEKDIRTCPVLGTVYRVAMAENENGDMRMAKTSSRTPT